MSLGRFESSYTSSLNVSLFVKREVGCGMVLYSMSICC